MGEKVITRFAPSPTGVLHFGSVRTAVFNYLFARANGGKFILRIEDTDLERSKKEFEESILEDMKWLGLEYDEVYRQSDRFDIYREYAQKLIDQGKAYYCTCSKEEIIERNKKRGINSTRYDGHCRGNTSKPDKPAPIRFNTGDPEIVSFIDEIRGEISVKGDQIDDFIIMKSDGSPTYNFAVVIDDYLMGMTHIIRGEDHITNTVKQILIYEALGWKPPRFAHLPLIVEQGGRPLSKRLGSMSVKRYRDEGYLPDALLNYTARLGWSYGNEEIFTKEQLIKYFDLSKVSKSASAFDEQKLLWVNQRHIKLHDIGKILVWFRQFVESAGLKWYQKFDDEKWLREAVEIIRQRARTLKEVYNELVMMVERPEIPDDLYDKLVKPHIEMVKKAIEEVEKFEGNDFRNLEGQFRKISDEAGKKFVKLAQAVRVLLTGSKISPSIFDVMNLIGKDETLARIKRLKQIKNS